MLYYKLRTLKSQLNIIPKGQNIMAGLFDTGSDLTKQISNIPNALNAGSNLLDIAKNARLGDINALVEGVGDVIAAVAAFTDDNPNDWRVRLSLPTWPSFRSSPVLAPLKDAGGLIFPYTPTIKIASSAKYTPINTVHTNYTFQAFQNSDPGEITVTAPMFCEDSTQGLYWIAMVHYLRSLTKMFAGNDAKAGNPPPLVFLNGYGNYVFKNVPVVVKSFSTSLDKDCDYIRVNVTGSEIGGITDGLLNIGDQLDIPGVDVVRDLADKIQKVTDTFGIGPTTGAVSYVPTKSSFSITLIPVYSRNSAKKFSLDRFVQGGYLNNSFGYI